MTIQEMREMAVEAIACLHASGGAGAYEFRIHPAEVPQEFDTFLGFPVVRDPSCPPGRMYLTETRAQ